MLQLIRERSQGLIVGVIVFFICLTFALFGVQQYLEGQTSVVVAEVNGEEVGLTEYQRAFQQIRQRAQAMYGDAFDPNVFASEQAKQNTLDYLIDEKLLLQASDKANLQASNLQVANYIRTSPQFQRDDEFSSDLYRQMVRALGFSELGFEQQVRKDFVVNQLRAGIAASDFTTAEELQQLERYRQQTRDVGYAIIGIETFKENVEATEEQVKAFFEDNGERYRIPEKLVLHYLDLSIDSLMKDVTANEEQLRAYYDANTAHYTVQEQRSANHILVQLKRDAGEEAEATALAKAQGLREQAMQGGSFEEIAKENSDDVGSRTDGGETGFFGRGVMAPEFEEAVFSMAPGAISEPVRTQFGYHIIRLNEVKEGGIKPFDEATSEVEEAYKREQAEALFFEQAERLSELAYEQPDSLDAASDALGLPIEKTEALDRSEIAVEFGPRLAEAAFEAEVLLEGLNSEPIDVSNTRLVVVRVEQHLESTIPAFADVQAQVKTDYIDAEARKGTNAHGAALVERLRNGEAVETVLAEESVGWEAVASASRETAKLNRAVARAAFKVAPANDASTVVYEGVPLGVGDYAIIGVSNVRLPEKEELNVSDISQLRRDVAEDRNSIAWRDFVEILKSDAKVESFPDRL